MKRSVDRILTTHTGSLPRPPDLRAMLQARDNGEQVDGQAFAERVRSAVTECVAKQAEAGIDVVSDGELGKPNFVMYVTQRLSGMEGWDDQLYTNTDPDFPGYEQWYASRGTQYFSPRGRPKCVGPLKWKDEDAVRRDIENLRLALGDRKVSDAFIPSASIGTIAQQVVNGYYGSYQGYAAAKARVMSCHDPRNADSGV